MTMRQILNIRFPQTSLHLGPSSSFSRPSIARPEAPLFQEGNLKTCPWSPHHTAHGGEEDRLLKFLTIVYPTIKPAVELVTPLPSSPPGDRTYSYQPVKYPPDVSQLHSRGICYCGPENEAWIRLVGISQVDKNTSCFLGVWMEVG